MADSRRLADTFQESHSRAASGASEWRRTLLGSFGYVQNRGSALAIPPRQDLDATAIYSPGYAVSYVLMAAVHARFGTGCESLAGGGGPERSHQKVAGVEAHFTGASAPRGRSRCDRRGRPAVHPPMSRLRLKTKNVAFSPISLWCVMAGQGFTSCLASPLVGSPTKWNPAAEALKLEHLP